MTIRIDSKIVACEVIGDRAAARKRGRTIPDRGEPPPDAQVCPRCHARAVVVVDGCPTCLECGETRCG